MRKLLIFKIVILLHSCFIFANDKELNKLKTRLNLDVKRTTQNDISNLLRQFVETTRPNRIPGTTGHMKAKRFILEEMAKYEGEISELSFKVDQSTIIDFYQKDFEKKVKGNFTPDQIEYKNAQKQLDVLKKEAAYFNGFEGRNLVWFKKGQTSKTLYILAHYDNIGVDTKTGKILKDKEFPGADHNASGVVVALKLMSLASKYNLQVGLKIVFFDFQALGFLGSEVLANDIKKKIQTKEQELVGIVNLDMVGSDTESGDKRGKLGNMLAVIPLDSNQAEKSLLGAFEVANKGKVNGLHFDQGFDHEEITDTFRFWGQGLPAVTLTHHLIDDPNSKLRTSNDFAETLNFGTLYKVYQYVSNGVMAVALGIVDIGT